VIQLIYPGYINNNNCYGLMTMSAQNCTHSIAITGSGGSGAITVGNMLLQQAAKNSLYGFMRRSVGPQIRGGESAALLRLSAQPVSCPDDRFDLLIAFDFALRLKSLWTVKA